jgi:hypothetical protein
MCYQGILLADLAFEPPVAAWLALLVSPHIVADIDSLIFLDPFVTDVAVILFQLLKEGLLEVLLL